MVCGLLVFGGQRHRSAALQRLPVRMGGRKVRDQQIHQGMRFVRMISSKITHIHIDRNRLCLRPGVDAQVRLCQEHRGRHTARAMAVGRKGVGQVVNRLQAADLYRLHAVGYQLRSIDEPVAFALAIVEIGGEVQTVHNSVNGSTGVSCHLWAEVSQL